MPHSSPPLPAKLLELLKDYPDHIEQLQKALISVNDGQQNYAPPLRPQSGCWRTVLVHSRVKRALKLMPLWHQAIRERSNEPKKRND